MKLNNDKFKRVIVKKVSESVGRYMTGPSVESSEKASSDSVNSIYDFLKITHGSFDLGDNTYDVSVGIDEPDDEDDEAFFKFYKLALQSIPLVNASTNNHLVVGDFLKFYHDHEAEFNKFMNEDTVLLEWYESPDQDDREEFFIEMLVSLLVGNFSDSDYEKLISLLSGKVVESEEGIVPAEVDLPEGISAPENIEVEPGLANNAEASGGVLKLDILYEDLESDSMKHFTQLVESMDDAVEEAVRFTVDNEQHEILFYNLTDENGKDVRDADDMSIDYRVSKKLEGVSSENESELTPEGRDILYFLTINRGHDDGSRSSKHITVRSPKEALFVAFEYSQDDLSDDSIVWNSFGLQYEDEDGDYVDWYDEDGKSFDDLLTDKLEEGLESIHAIKEAAEWEDEEEKDPDVESAAEALANELTYDIDFVLDRGSVSVHGNEAVVELSIPQDLDLDEISLPYRISSSVLKGDYYNGPERIVGSYEYNGLSYEASVGFKVNDAGDSVLLVEVSYNW